MNNGCLNFRTDMADERVDEYKKVHNLSEIDGIKVTSNNLENLKITTVEVLNENGANVLSKEIGKYITIELQDVKYIDDKSKQIAISKIFDEIKLLIGDNNNSIMIVGLGNIYVTPDSLGPKVVKYLDITRHLFKFAPQYIEKGTREISGISPGVLGTTGIETMEIVESISKKVKPDLIIVIDSLLSQSTNRLGKTIQIGNTGIVPGAGVKNKREGINEKTLNIPVIAIGVPTVVDMATITNETIDKILEDESVEDKSFESLDNVNRYNTIADKLNTENYIVTLKEIDEIIDKMSEIISSSLNLFVSGN